VKIDLRDLVAKAFGATYLSAVQVAIHASCRLFRVYIADRDYADVELPPFLRLLNPNAEH